MHLALQALVNKKRDLSSVQGHARKTGRKESGGAGQARAGQGWPLDPESSRSAENVARLGIGCFWRTVSASLL
jgi:hypothetical protein